MMNLPNILRRISLNRDGNDSTAELAKGIKSPGSTLITLQDGTTRVQFRHVNALYPGVIIKISNLQTTKDLAYLADQYVVETSGSVKVVVGIKLDYRGTLKAELSLWRPQYVKENGQEYLIPKQEISSEIR